MSNHLHLYLPLQYVKKTQTKYQKMSTSSHFLMPNFPRSSNIAKKKLIIVEFLGRRTLHCGMPDVGHILDGAFISRGMPTTKTIYLLASILKEQQQTGGIMQGAATALLEGGLDPNGPRWNMTLVRS